MSFTYDLANNPALFYVRLLIPDTDPDHAIFGDDEIQAFFTIASSVYQSGAFYGARSGRTMLPSTPVSYLRVAALALDALASGKARLASVTRLLDVELSPAQASSALSKKADDYRRIDDESGAFAVIEQVITGFSFRDQLLKSMQRQIA